MPRRPRYTDSLSVGCRCMRPDQLRGHLGMLLLAVLASGPTHGYALSAELRRLSGGVLAIVEGSLYPALHRLEATGLVASSTETIDGRRRRRYELTADGKAALDDEMHSWKEFKACVDGVLREITWGTAGRSSSTCGACVWRSSCRGSDDAAS